MSKVDVFGIAVATIALLLARKITTAGARDLLLSARAAPPGSPIGEAEVLELAGIQKADVSKALSFARSVIERGTAQGIVPLPINADEYPPTLRMIADAPPLLYLRGSAQALSSTPGVSVVGTRKATRHGLTIAERVSEYISTHNLVVVSGLALGIDAAAHEGALRGGAPTIAVLAHGLDKASPRTNEPLAHRILEAGGAWVSEHPVLTPARPQHFVLRNRIQVGLSAASIIVEGKELSGSMTQAEFCIRNRRVLFAVLPPPGSTAITQKSLPEMLVRDRGAIPLRSKEDYPSMLERAMRRRAEMLASAESNRP